MNKRNTFISLIVAATLVACSGDTIPITTTDEAGEVSSPKATQAPQFNFTPVVIEAISPPAFSLYSELPALGLGGTWDNTMVMPGALVFHEGLFHMFYNGSSGVEGESATETIGYAISQDGYQWLRTSEEPVLFSGTPDYAIGSLEVSSALVEPDGTWVMYLTVGLEGSLFSSGVGRATASNPTGPWTIDNSLVLLTESPERWDGKRIAFPVVIRTETGYVMYYSGFGADPRNPAIQIGMATSPDGITWTKYDDPATTDKLYADSDPVFGVGAQGTWDETSVYNSQVIRTEDNWVMLYIGYQTGEFNQRTTNVGFATSLDGTTWERFEGNPVFFPEAVMPNFDFGLMLWNYHDNTHFLYFDAFHKSFYTAEIYLATSE